MTPPDPLSLVVAVIAVAVLGRFLDSALASARFADWRASLGRLWAALRAPHPEDLLQEVHRGFVTLFDLVYGRRALSLRRLGTSVLSSLLALFVLTLLMGYEHSVWRLGLEDVFEPVFSWEQLVLLVVSPLVLNLVPDWFSLAETRWVLGQARGRGPAALAGLFVLDLALTLVIFALGVALMQVVDLALVQQVFADPLQYDTKPLRGYLEWTLLPWGGLVFLLSTFVTSLFWLLYAGCFGVIRLLHRLLPVADFIYAEVRDSRQPGLTVAAFFNGLVILGYLLWLAAAWLFRG